MADLAATINSYSPDAVAAGVAMAGIAVVLAVIRMIRNRI